MGERPVPGRLAGRAAAVVAITAVLTALTALLAACGGGDAPTPPAPTATPAPTPEAWTESVCAAVVPVVAHLTNAPRLDLSAPEATRQAFLTYLDTGVTVTDRARAEVAAAGPAPVPDGDVIAEQVRGDLADLRSDLTDARDQVQRTDTGSAAGVARAVVGVGRVVGALLNGAQVAATINKNPTLKAAYDASPSCAQLQRSGAPATPAPTPAVVPTR